jgi:hypothetical protein
MLLVDVKDAARHYLAAALERLAGKAYKFDVNHS